MPTIAAGNTAEIYVPLDATITVTPGTNGHVNFGVAVRSGSAAVAPTIIRVATSVDVPAGSTVFAEAVGANATYTDPASVSGAGIAVPTSRPIASADDQAILYPAAGVTLTWPAGLSPAPRVIIVPAPIGVVNLAVSGGATLNGATSALTRALADNYAGFAVMPQGVTDAYGVGGA